MTQPRDVSGTGIRDVEDHYRSGTHSLGADFFKPCLASATRYRRAAGYFSSSAIASWMEALPRLLDDEPLEIQLLVSPRLTPQDVHALSQERSAQERREYRSHVVEGIAEELAEFALTSDDPSRSRYARLFARLVVSGLIQLRIAFPEVASSVDLYHEKFGIFDFRNGDQIAFSGSANETASGHYRNFESVDVYRSWVSEDQMRVTHKVRQFDEAWNNETIGLEVIPLTQAALDKLRSIGNHLRATGQVITDAHEDPRWAHQNEAVRKFLTHRAGILEMATGTGKTRTALMILRDLIQNHDLAGAIVATEGTDLLDQWQVELDAWFVSHGISWPVYRQFDKHYEASRYLLDPDHSVLLLSRSQLPRVLPRISSGLRSAMAIIHDEVHGLGIPSLRETLQLRDLDFGWRLGLSATPERSYDDAGNEFIESSVGPTIFRFPLEEAIQRRVLSGFDYTPLPYVLTEDDRRRLQNVHLMKAARARIGKPMRNEEIWTEIAKVYKTAEMKPSVFEDYLRRQPSVLRRCIIFVETMEYGDRILPSIHAHTTRYRTYYAEDDRSHLVAFANGKIDVLITCHRLSQGIDIRSLESVVLFASARSKLETIQRIGRCLRIDPENPEKRAQVVDFVREPSRDANELDADQERCKWLSDLAEYPKERS